MSETMMQTLWLGIGTLILAIVNIGLGSITALVNKEWNWSTFWKGVIKMAIVVVAFAAVWFVGWLNEELIIIELDGKLVNLCDAVHIILLSGFVAYGGKVLVKLKDVFVSKSSDKSTDNKEDNGNEKDT